MFTPCIQTLTTTPHLHKPSLTLPTPHNQPNSPRTSTNNTTITTTSKTSLNVHSQQSQHTFTLTQRQQPNKSRIIIINPNIQRFIHLKDKRSQQKTPLRLPSIRVNTAAQSSHLNTPPPPPLTHHTHSHNHLKQTLAAQQVPHHLHGHHNHKGHANQTTFTDHQHIISSVRVHSRQVEHACRISHSTVTHSFISSITKNTSNQFSTTNHITPHITFSTSTTSNFIIRSNSTKSLNFPKLHQVIIYTQ